MGQTYASHGPANCREARMPRSETRGAEPKRCDIRWARDAGELSLLRVSDKTRIQPRIAAQGNETLQADIKGPGRALGKKRPDQLLNSTQATTKTNRDVRYDLTQWTGVTNPIKINRAVVRNTTGTGVANPTIIPNAGGAGLAVLSDRA